MIACRGLALAVLSVVGLWSLPSWAEDTPVALDLHYVSPLSPSAIDGGAGIAGRIGRRFKPAPWLITPELMAAYETFGGPGEARQYRGLGGIRIGYDTVVRPGIFLHGGVGKSSFEPLAAPGMSHTAFTFDAGAFVDLTLLPLVNVGAHVGYNQLLKSSSGDNGIKWLSIGLQAELVL